MTENSHDNLQLRHQNALNMEKGGSSLVKRGKALQESDNQRVKQCGELLENYGFWLQEYAQATLLYLEIKTLDGLIGGYGKATQAHVKATYALQQAIAISQSIKTKFIEIIDREESKQELLDTTYSDSTQESNINNPYIIKSYNTQIQERQVHIQKREARIQERQARIQERQTRIQEHQTRIQERQTLIQECQARSLELKLRIENTKYELNNQVLKLKQTRF